MDIGFIGLGNMGAHMARRLLEADHKASSTTRVRKRSAISPRSARLPRARRPKSPMPPPKP